VLDGVRVVVVGLLEVSHEVVYWWSCLALHAVFSSCDTLYVGAIYLLVVIIIEDSHGYDPLREPLPPLLATFDILVGALDGDAGRCHLGAAGGSLPAA
jgi:hypothetical protein